MPRGKGGFGSFPLTNVWGFTEEWAAKQHADRLREQPYGRENFVRLFERTVRAGGAVVRVWVVVGRQKRKQ